MEPFKTFARPIKDYSLVLKLYEQRLSLELKNITSDFFFSIVLQNTKLPSNLINIFDSVQQIYEYINRDKNVKIALNATDKLLLIGVPSPNSKIKMLQFPVSSMPIQKDEIIERELARHRDDIKNLSQKVDRLEKILTKHIQKEKVLRQQLEYLKRDKGHFLKKGKRNSGLGIQLSSNICQQGVENNRDQQNQADMNQSALCSKFQQQEPFIIQPILSFNSSMKCKSSSNEEKVSQSNAQINNRPLDNTNQNLSNSQRQLKKQISKEAQDFYFDIDEGNKNISFFTINDRKIIKKYDSQDQIYQLYSSNPIPEVGKHLLTFKIEKITDGTMWFGLITEDKKIEQYIGSEAENIYLGCQQGNQLSISGKMAKIQFEQMKSGQLLVMEVDLSAKRVKFFKNLSSLPLADVPLPKDMVGKKIFPFFQLMTQYDSIRLI